MLDKQTYLANRKTMKIFHCSLLWVCPAENALKMLLDVVVINKIYSGRFFFNLLKVNFLTIPVVC